MSPVTTSYTAIHSVFNFQTNVINVCIGSSGSPTILQHLSGIPSVISEAVRRVAKACSILVTGSSDTGSSSTLPWSEPSPFVDIDLKCENDGTTSAVLDCLRCNLVLTDLMGKVKDVHRRNRLAYCSLIVQEEIMEKIRQHGLKPSRKRKRQDDEESKITTMKKIIKTN